MLALHSLLAEARQVVSRVVAGADGFRLRREVVRAQLTKDAALRVLARLVVHDRVLEVEMLLRDVLLDDRSIIQLMRLVKELAASRRGS